MRWTGVLCGLVLAMAGTARADEPPPWARGVTEAQKAAAQALLEAGNAQFLAHDYVAALEKYKQAIAAWDHPAIRFNIVRCLVQLDRPLEADDELQRALAFGAAPLEDAVYGEALGYQKLLAKEIGHLGLRCAQRGVELSLDGQHALTCPGSVDVRVTPGPHQVLGTRDGFAAKAEKVVVVGGAREDVTLELVPLARSGVIVRRWPSWKPWAVVGAGLGVAGLGALIDYQASRDMTSYDQALVGACLDVGCGPNHPIPASVAAQKTSATRESAVGVSLLAAGGAAAVTGAVLVYLNREHLAYPAEHLAVVPQAGGAAVSWLGRF